MSSGMLLLAGLFATGPVTAPPCETAPMPRAKRGTLQLEFRVDLTPRGLTLGAGVGPAKPDAYRVEAGHGLRIGTPQVGPSTCPTTTVHETRTGQFMISGGVNSNAGVGGDIILVERDVARLPAFRPEPQVLVCPGPVGPPPEIHAMMMQAIGQMGGPVAAPCPAPPMCVPPAPAQVAWAAPVPTFGRTMPMGVWSREVGPVKYKIEFKGQTLIATTTLTEEDDDGKSFSIDHVLTADWYPTKNEHEIVGLITGFDIATNGKAMKRDDVSGLLGSLADIQKQFSGKPIALTCRHNGETMQIGDVRMPALKDDYSELSSAFAAMGGNYEAAKATRAAAPATLPVVPASVGGRGLTYPRPAPQPPQYIPYESFPMPLEQPQRIGVDFNFNPPRFYGHDRLPPMPPPAPLPKTNPFRNGGLTGEQQNVPTSRSNPFPDGWFIR